MTPNIARMPIVSTRSLAELEFVAFDTETTGCASATGRMVEIGAVKFRLDGTETGRFSKLINPLRPIPWTVTRVHGITDDMVRDCPTEEDVLPEFVAFLGDPDRTIGMAHNASFDLAFVGAALARTGMSAPAHVVVDTVRLSRRRAAGLPSHSLRSLVRWFGVGETTEHRGLSDSVALRQVFLHLVAKPPEPRTAGDLFALSPPRPFLVEQGSYRRPSEAAFGSRRRASGQLLPGRIVTEAVVLGPSATCPSRGGREVLGDAIAAGRIVSLVYDGGSSAGERRSVTPLRLIGSAEITYLLAFCHTDRKRKQYRLDRIRDLVIE